MENRHQALQTIIYKAKKKLKDKGLPDVNYIVLEKGVYYWTSEIPVIEDADLFDRLYDQANACMNEDEKLELCLEACYTYKGEFLSSCAAVLWASVEARRYRERFCECVEWAASIIRNRQDWIRLEELGRYVVEVLPYADWEKLIMEALIGSGRYEEAVQFYADTADNYPKVQGVSPSAKMMEMMGKLGGQIQHTHEALDQIQQGLSEEMDGRGGYQCSYPVFQGIYHMVVRLMERGGQSVYLMLCTLVDGKGNPMREGERLEEMSSRLNEAIRYSVRHGDIVNQYGKGQFLVLLVNTTRENCEIVEKRINQKFIVGRQRVGVQYHINSVICEI